MDLRSTWFPKCVARILFFFASFSWFLKFKYGCTFRHFSLMCPSIFQWLQLFPWYFHWCAVDFIFLSFPPFHLFSPLEYSRCSFSWNPFATLSHGLCFLDIVPINMPHTWSLDWKESLYFVDGYVDYLNTWGSNLGSWERYPTWWLCFWTWWCTHVHFVLDFSWSSATRSIGPIHTR